MKIFCIIVLVFFGAAISMNLKENLDFLDHHQNIEMVVDTAMNGTQYIAEELYSFEHNKLRAKLTSWDAKEPAFDMLFDYTEGYMLFYYNLTGDCRVLDLPKMDMKAYYRDIMVNHTEYAGKRGHLELFEVKEPRKDSRTWVYGLFTHHEESNRPYFMPVRMQTHDPMLHVDFTNEMIDTITFPEVTAADFDYSMCKKTTYGGEVEHHSMFNVAQTVLKAELITM